MSESSPIDAPYRDATRPEAERVDDLLGRMTLDEKVAQLTGILPFDLLGPAGLDEQKFDEHLADGLGEISAGALLSPDPRAPRGAHAPRHPCQGSRAARQLGDRHRVSPRDCARHRDAARALGRPAPPLPRRTLGCGHARVGAGRGVV